MTNEELIEELLDMRALEVLAAGENDDARWRELHAERKPLEQALLAKLNRCDQLERELAALKASTGWQPIETAPKDGTQIDLWHKKYGRITNCMFDDGDWFENDGWGFAVEQARLITHWMPIPEAPEVNE